MPCAAAEAGTSLQTSACALFSWNQSVSRVLLVPFWQLAVSCHYWPYPFVPHRVYEPEHPHLMCGFLLGPHSWHWEIWTSLLNYPRDISDDLCGICLGISAVRTAKTHFLLYLKSPQELLSYELHVLAVWVGGLDLCLAGETVFWHRHLNIHEKL